MEEEEEAVVVVVVGGIVFGDLGWGGGRGMGELREEEKCGIDGRMCGGYG